MNVAMLHMNAIAVADDRRAVRDVAGLMASITEVGLLQPIVVTEDFRLVAGRHRLEAFRRMGRETIPARVVSLSQIDAQLAEIDENLARNELTALERSEQLAKRKALYEAKHPETKRGGDKKSDVARDQMAESAVRSFSEDTAAKTGIASRTIREDVQIANRLAPDVKSAIRDMPIADKKTELLELARKPAEEQREVVEALKRGDRDPKSGPRPQPKIVSADPIREAARALAKVPTHRFAELVAEMSEQTIRLLLMCLRDRLTSR